MKRTLNPIYLTVCYTILLLLYLSYAGNTWNGDRDAYESYYIRSDISAWGFEILYGYSNIYFHQLGLSYQTFQSIIAFLTISLVYKYIKNSSNKIILCLLIYSILIFPLDYVLMRTSLAYAIILNALLILEKNQYIRYTLYVLIASLIHISSIIFILLIFYKQIKFIHILYFIIIEILFLYISTYLPIEPNNITNHLQIYATSQKTGVFYSTIQILSTFFLYKSHDSQKKYSFILKINIIFLILIPIYFYTNIIIRPFRLLIFINIIFFTSDIILNKKIKVINSLYIFIFGLFLFHHFIYLTMELSFYPLFSHNLFFSLFKGLLQ
ncbi:hypothetical protein B9T10_05810 [Wohlfahrtiimonas chitiniclastica]|uniref:EpsG family protein n=1 Tax=Wohlfahrtiimonas chitiniclastica TaxID=400946 RepID=UPI000B985D22|nr:hypothetical protein B9T13_04300 [Wohlfahrtiimonas chitiniclastica]OYQ88806.1 hypothetical protein B9T10_05810 [Wohlfahrtiimonas chitiniclastica]